jgi:pseudomonalisin
VFLTFRTSIVLLTPCFPWLYPQLVAQTLTSRPVDRVLPQRNPMSVFPKVQLLGPIEDGANASLAGNVHPEVRKELDAGPVEEARWLSRMTLCLKRDPSQQAALDAFSKAVQDPQSPLYHHWLTPQEFGAHFGISQNDLERITEWLKRHGFTVEDVPAGRWTIVFSGTVGSVQSTFGTAIRYYKTADRLHFANAEAPRIPAALDGMVLGISGLNDFDAAPRPQSNRGGPQGQLGNSARFLNPSDFAAIYNLNPLYDSGIQGNGVSIAVVEPCSMDVSLAQTFWQMEGLSQGSNWYWNYGSPSTCGSDDVGEVFLDYEWAGAIAPQAQIWLVSSGGSGLLDSLFDAVNGVVNNNFAPVVTLSYTVCGSQTYYDSWINLWQQAHASGITGIVAAGDTGPTTCETKMINGLCHSEYVTCVGGTQFQADTTNPDAYWSSSGQSLSYIPEAAWNETSGSNPWGASGGGYSSFHSRPDWQIGNNTGYRGIPDLAFTAASHDAYRICIPTDNPPCDPDYFRSIAGTSAAAPAFAGAVALLIQKNSLQGSVNPALYSLATRQDLGLIFHDVTQGNNSVPGQQGYSAGPGWDPVTGLGSADLTALFTNWPGSQGSSLSIADQRVTSTAPPASGCSIPPSVSSFLTTDSTVYLYFQATVTANDSLSIAWLGPGNTLMNSGGWGSVSGTYCFIGAALDVSNTPSQLLGNWQALVYDNGNLVIAVPFTVNSH